MVGCCNRGVHSRCYGEAFGFTLNSTKSVSELLRTRREERVPLGSVVGSPF